MKKISLLVLALLLCFGVVNSFATNIPQVTDPKNYPTVWTELVYNGSGSTISSGHVAIWDFDTSDSDAGTYYDDTASWVKTCDAADSIWTAGVLPLGQDIANGDVGRIIIRGPAVVVSRANTTTVNTVVSGTTSGECVDESGGADKTILGIVIKESAAAVDIGAEAYSDETLVYVNPTTEGN